MKPIIIKLMNKSINGLESSLDISAVPVDSSTPVSFRVNINLGHLINQNGASVVVYGFLTGKREYRPRPDRGIESQVEAIIYDYLEREGYRLVGYYTSKDDVVPRIYSDREIEVLRDTAALLTGAKNLGNIF